MFDTQEEELQDRERNLASALQMVEGKFQAQLASQAEKALLDKDAALQALSGQHHSELEVVVAEKDRLTEAMMGLEQKLFGECQWLATSFELEQASKELIAGLNHRMADHDKKVESIKVIQAETTSELAVLQDTHE